MKTDKEILDRLGELLIKKVFDSNYEILKQNISFYLEQKQLSNNIDKVTGNIMISLLFDFLKIFEEHEEEYKIVYHGEGKEINLVEISEMLKAEHLGENGWIVKYSKQKKQDEII